MSKLFDHVYIASTVAFAVYSQLVMRWQVSAAGALPGDLLGKMSFVGQQFLNPWVLSSILASLLSGVSWMLAMTRFEVSYAYPWVSVNYLLMLPLGVLLFEEAFNLAKGLGTFLIVAGIVVIARSQ